MMDIALWFKEYLSKYTPYKTYWNYEDGCVLKAAADLYRATRDEVFRKFVLDYGSTYVTEDGSIPKYEMRQYNSDSINAGKALFFALEQTGEERYRKAIEASPARLEVLAQRLKEQDVFRLGGEEYKRPKGDVGELLNPWYNRKWLSIGCHRDFGEELFDPALPERLAEGFAFLMPYYEYILEIMPREGQEE